MRRAMSTVRLGVAGLGYWGPNLARMWGDLEDCRLAWLCDLDEGLLDRTGRQLPQARRTTCLDEVLSDPDVDAVSIATSVPTHADLALRAIEAGKHVFVEKPLATSVAEAELVSRAATAAGRMLIVGHLLVHHPGVVMLKQLSDSGELGRMHYLYSHRVNLGRVRADENALWSLGAHDVSVLLHLVGSPPTAVSAHGQCFIREGVEDVVFCVLRFDGGVIAHLQLSWLDPHKVRRFTVVGSEKMAQFDDMSLDQKVTIYDKGITRNGGCPDDPARATRPASYGEYVQIRQGDTFIPRISPEEPLRIQGRHFVRCVLGLEQPKAGGPEGVAAVAVLEALQDSLRHGGAVVPMATPVAA